MDEIIKNENKSNNYNKKMEMKDSSIDDRTKRSISKTIALDNLLILLFSSLFLIFLYLIADLVVFFCATIIFYVFFVIHQIYYIKTSKKVDMNNISFMQYYLIELGSFVSGFIYLMSVLVLGLVFIASDLPIEQSEEQSKDLFNYVTVFSFIIVVFLEGAFPKAIEKGIYNNFYIINKDKQEDINKLFSDYRIFNIVGIILIAFFVTLMTVVVFVSSYI